LKQTRQAEQRDAQPTSAVDTGLDGEVFAEADEAGTGNGSWHERM